MALKIAILASGSGTNAQSMIDKAAQGVLDVDTCLIAGNRPGAKVFERAKKAGIPHVCIDTRALPTARASTARWWPPSRRPVRNMWCWQATCAC